MSSRPLNPTRRRLLAGFAPAAALLVTSSSDAIGETGSQQKSLEEFGFKGDGVADDTAAIQSAVDAGVGKIVFWGVTRLTRTVVIELDRVGYTSLLGEGTARIRMEGPGPAFRFVGTHGGTADPHSVKENVWERQRMPLVDGLEIVGAHEQACGIEAVGTMAMILTRLHIRDCFHAVHLRTRNRNVIIDDCHFYHNRGIGVYYDQVDLHQSNIGNSHISYNAGGGIVSRGGNVRNIHIGNCDLEGNHPAVDSPSESATANVLIDCRASKYGTAEVAITGCTIQHTARSPDSANIRIVGASVDSREGHVTITGNVFSDVQTNVHLDSVRGATITGNTFWMGFAHNLLIEHCAELAIGTNNFNRNPRYAHSKANTATHDLVIRDSQDVTLTGLVISGVQQKSGALQLTNCRRVSLTGCTITDNDGPGIAIRDCQSVIVGHCVIRDDRPQTQSPIAMVIEASQEIHVSDNLIRGTIQKR